MKLILSKDEALKLDIASIDKGYVSNNDLMKNAGMISAQYFIDKVNSPFNKKVLVLAGNGNNGGDALIMHHYLIKYGVKSHIYFFNRNHQKKIIVNYKMSMNNEIFNIDSDILESFDWFVDGIFGIGLNRPIKGKYEKIIRLLKNKSIFSLDIPSGINPDTGYLFSDIFCKPSIVASMGYLKPGNIMNNGKQFFKNTKILDINFPKAENVINAKSKFIIDKKDIMSILKEDDFLKNKFSSFSSLIVGSREYSGAGVLSLLATLKSGSNYVQTLVPGKISEIYESSCYESKIIGFGNKDYFSENNVKRVVESISIRKGPVLIGPGLGSNKKTKSFIIEVLKFLKNDKYKCIIDASGFEGIKPLS